MDKPPAKPPKTGNSLLQLLTRRSTKVDPAVQPPNTTTAVAPATSSATRPLPLLVGNGSAGGYHATTSSAHASPINQFRQSYVRRHSSTQNLSTIIRDEANSPLRKPANGGVAKKSKPLNNRFSHQFTLCCSFHDDRIYTPPVSVRYNSLAQNSGGGALLTNREPTASSTSPNATTSTTTTTLSPVFSGGGGSSSGDGTSASTSTSTTVVTVHRDGVRDRDPQSSPEVNAVSRAHSSKSNNSSSTSSSAACRKSSTEPNTPAKQLQPPHPHQKQTMSSPPAPIRNPRHQQFIQQAKTKPPVFDEFQAPSIAMSACRSRLRQKLMPPGGSLDLPLMSSSATAAAGASGSADAVQHFSSPNITSGGVRLLARDSVDADCDSAETESALMAATEEGVAANRSLSYDVLTGVKRPASADSLAKQSLIAAQLLNLIPAERARERCLTM